MQFNSIEFLLFLPIVYLIYWYLLRSSLRWQNVFVIVVSYVFYGWWNWRLLGLIIFTSFLGWGGGLLTERVDRKKAKCDSGILLNPLHYLKILLPLKSLVFPVAYQDLGLGGYTRLERDKLSEDLTIKGADTPRKAVPQMHVYNVSYLHKIYDYCQKQHLELIFFNMPSYPTQAIIDGNKSLHQFVEENYPDVPFYDYELMQLPDSCYGDAAHLNYRGAKIISEQIAEDLRDYTR